MNAAAAFAGYLARHVEVWAFDAHGPDGNVFVQRMPPTPHTAVAVMSTGGLPYRTLAPVALPSIQLLVRGEPHAGPGVVYRHAAELLELFDGLDGAQLFAGPGDLDGPLWLIGCSALQSDPVPLGVDDLERHEYSVNLQARVSRPTELRPAVGR